MAKRRSASARKAPSKRAGLYSRRAPTRRARPANRSNVMRLVIETAQPAPQFIPAHLGPGGGIVPSSGCSAVEEASVLKPAAPSGAALFMELTCR